MRRLATLAPVVALALAACSQEQPEADTAYEEELPSPVANSADEDAPAPVNTSTEGGADEQVDAMAADKRSGKIQPAN